MVNLLCVFVTMPVGGAETFWINVLKKIDRSRFNPITCCISTKGFLGEQIENMGFEVIELGRIKSRRFDFGAVRELSRVIDERKIDIVHAHMYHPGLYGRLAALFSGRKPKTVYSIHSLYTRRKLHKTLLNYLLNKYTSRIIAVSEPIREDILTYDQTAHDKIVILNNGIDIDRLDIPLLKNKAKERLGLKADDFVLGTVGRLIEEKGHTYLLKALSLTRGKGYKFKLIIVGPGKLEDQLKKESVALGIDSDVVFLGQRSDIPELYRAMDVYVMSSLWEGAPLAVIDAMACGLPCVVTSVGGMPNQVDNGKCGVVVPSKDSAGLADAIISLYDAEDKRLELSAKAFDRARRLYGSDRMVRDLQAMYLNL